MGGMGLEVGVGGWSCRTQDLAACVVRKLLAGDMLIEF